MGSVRVVASRATAWPHGGTNERTFVHNFSASVSSSTLPLFALTLTITGMPATWLTTTHAGCIREAHAARLRYHTRRRTHLPLVHCEHRECTVVQPSDGLVRNNASPLAATRQHGAVNDEKHGDHAHAASYGVHAPSATPSTSASHTRCTHAAHDTPVCVRAHTHVPCCQRTTWQGLCHHPMLQVSCFAHGDRRAQCGRCCGHILCTWLACRPAHAQS